MWREIYRPVYLLQLILVFGVLLSGAAAQSPTPYPSPTPGQTVADIARQEKEKQQQKQKTASRVYSNEDVADAHDNDNDNDAGSASAPAAVSKGNATNVPASTGKLTAAQWSDRIFAQKQAINDLQEQADELKASIHYVYAQDSSVYSIDNQAWRVRYNTVQKRKQDQWDQMQQQIENEKQDLEELQDVCNKQGYGTNVCDPT